MQKPSNKQLSKVLITLVISLFSVTSYAQVDAYEFGNFNPLVDDISEKLPPLDALLDSAVANSPSVQYQDYKADYYRYEVKSARIAWTEHFGIQSEVNYGHWYYDDYIETAQTYNYPRNKWTFFYSESHRANFNVGLYLRMPFQAIFDRRNNINKQKKWVEIELTMREIETRKVREAVIEMYNQLLQNQKMLKRSNHYQEWTRIQMMMAKNQFLDGEISVAEFVRLKEIETRGAMEHEKYVHEFITAYDLLQERTGMKFNLIKEVQ